MTDLPIPRMKRRRICSARTVRTEMVLSRGSPANASRRRHQKDSHRTCERTLASHLTAELVLPHRRAGLSKSRINNVLDLQFLLIHFVHMRAMKIVPQNP